MTASELPSTSPAIPPTQRVWRAVRRGTPASAIELDSNAPVSTDLPPGDVLVKVDAAALNPVGYKMLGLAPNFVTGRPHVAENDLAGTVVASNSAAHPVGERVFGYIPVPLHMGRKTKEGALAQYTRLPGDHLAHVPDGVSTVDAAGLALVGETALQCLVDFAQVEAGQTILINGGSSSVGVIAVQMAKALGCTVWATASGKNEEFVKSYGADVFLDYTKAPLHEQLIANPPQPKFHAIIDAVGLMDQSLYTHSEAYLQPNGTFVSTMGGPRHFTEIFSFIWAMRPVILGGVPRKWKSMLTKHTEKDLLQIAQWLEEGKVKPVTDSVHEFDDLMKAYDRIQTGRARGKVIVRVNPEAK